MVVELYVIIVYDVNQNKVSKLCNYLRTKLNWIQNSAFEGEITKSQLLEIKASVKEIVNVSSDSVLIFIIRNKQWLNKEIIGIEKSPTQNII